ncbi:hypothetical protein ACXYMU_05885 [Pontibacter sp. CAU 1760]
MSQDYKKVKDSFRELLEEIVAKKPFTRIQYFSDIREFITTTAIPKALFEQDGAEYLRLATGEVIRLDRIVRVGDKAAPGYSEDYFQCDI